jgi:NAD(P)-dependent dehydrogenase (short-subunit alcohol dehydrogenase family)
VFTDAGSAKTGHTAIVTGANHGIGAATARVLAQRGSAVVCAFLRVDDAAHHSERHHAPVSGSSTRSKEQPANARHQDAAERRQHEQRSRPGG